MRIKKVINNNIVCGCDEKNREMIVTGKGIGFGKKPNDEIEQDKVRKIYCMTNSSVQRRLIELMGEIPYEHLRLTDEFNHRRGGYSRKTCGNACKHGKAI